MSHQKAKLLHVEKSLYGLDWCRVFHYKVLMNPLTFAKMLVRKNLDDIACIQCVEYVINFNSCNVAVIRCWEREADITE